MMCVFLTGLRVKTRKKKIFASQVHSRNEMTSRNQYMKNQVVICAEENACNKAKSSLNQGGYFYLPFIRSMFLSFLHSFHHYLFIYLFLAANPYVPGSIPGATRFSEYQWVWNGVRSAFVRINEPLERKVATPV
jgi:hypothetical protein